MQSEKKCTGDGPIDNAAFGPAQPIRRGNVSERFVKCSRPGCPCAHDPEARHGPYYSLTRSVGGRTKSRYLSEEEAELVRRQIDNGRCFRKELEAYWQDCECCADKELEALQQEKTGGAERGGFKRRSRRVLRPRSST